MCAARPLAVELANHAEVLALTDDSYRTRQRRQLLARASRAADDELARRAEALRAKTWGCPKRSAE
jgi:hypothetical protein